jgi:hypothetical protein
LPSTCYFGLSSKSIDATSPYSASDVLNGGSGEITGTGYTRDSESEPTATDGLVQFAQQSFPTGAATDWPSAVRSVFLATSSDNSGVMICAWNLQTGGTARNLAQANVTENVTPQLDLNNV